MSPYVLDLSHWNTITDWTAIPDAGIVGVIHKATEGDSYVDPTYTPRRRLARDAGLEWGAYHFLRPGDMEAQAHYFLAKAKPDENTLLAADHEDAGVSLNDLKLFLRTVNNALPQVPLLYSGNLIKEQLGNNRDAELANYRLWLAQYTSGQPSWPKATWPSWWLWQYTDQGSIAGVSGGVDLNTHRQSHLLLADWTGSSWGGSVTV